MTTARTVQIIAYGLAAITTVLAIFVWMPSAENSITSYILFPLFGLIAFGLMWGHYVIGAVRRMLGVEKEALGRYFALTSWLVLLCILAHPFLLEFQLYIDGMGLPPGSLFETYLRPIDRLALLAGFLALLCFLSYELYRFFQTRTWWKYVEWLNVAAMCLIIWHGFVLGGELRMPWFQIIWAGYALSFVASVAYTGYDKRRNIHAGTSII